jgi:hypothetical protein
MSRVREQSPEQGMLWQGSDRAHLSYMYMLPIYKSSFFLRIDSNLMLRNKNEKGSLTHNYCYPLSRVNRKGDHESTIEKGIHRDGLLTLQKGSRKEKN